MESSAPSGQPVAPGGRLPAGESPGATKRRDRAFRDAAARLGWCAVVALGLEAGNWLKIAVTADVEAVEKVGQSHHADEYRARVVVWTEGKLWAEMLRDELLRRADAGHVRMGQSIVAWPVAACWTEMRCAASDAGVALHSAEDWAREVERRVG